MNGSEAADVAEEFLIPETQRTSDGTKKNCSVNKGRHHVSLGFGVFLNYDSCHHGASWAVAAYSSSSDGTTKNRFLGVIKRCSV